jgi:hypothetical protein
MTHRQERLAEIAAALDAGDRTTAQIVARGYADVPQCWWPFAAWSVRAQLEYLRDEGRLPRASRTACNKAKQGIVSPILGFGRKPQRPAA